MTPLLALTCVLLIAQDSTEKSFSDKVRKQATGATVKVANTAGRSEGSGVLIKRFGPHIYVLTAAHLVRKTSKVDVQVHLSGKSTKPFVARSVKVLARSEDADLALLRFATSEKLPAALAICPRKRGPGKSPFEALSVGWVKERAPAPLVEKVKRKVSLRRPGTTRSIWAWETQRPPAAGRSGGPLLDGRGRVIGIASGHGTRLGYYVHSDEIHTFLKRNGVGWLAEEEER